MYAPVRLQKAFFCLMALVLAISITAESAQSAPKPEQVNQAKGISAQVKKAGALYRAKKFKESAAEVRAAQAELAKLISSGEPKDILSLAKPLRTGLE
jgi:hypothetical protein